MNRLQATIEGTVKESAIVALPWLAEPCYTAHTTVAPPTVSKALLCHLTKCPTDKPALWRQFLKLSSFFPVMSSRQPILAITPLY